VEEAAPVRTPAVPRWQAQITEDIRGVRRYSKPLQDMLDRDANEGDTRLIVNDVLTSVLGFDRFNDLSTEFQIRGEFADYALRIDGQLVAMVEVKRVAQKLNDRHLRQVESYGLKEGVDWLILTNGIVWSVYHLSAATAGEQVRVEKAFEVDLLGSLSKQDLANLSLIHKQSIKRGLLADAWKKLSALSPANILRTLMAPRVITALRQEVKSTTAHNASDDDIRKALKEALA
jgi:predicted type IV restriction endonuclease